jgi:IPT/TIG domain
MDAQGNLYVGNYDADSIAVFGPGSSISSVSPKSGPVSGGTAITITGTGFSADPVVTVGGVAATDVTVVSATEITAVTPAHAAGAADVRVTSGGSTAVDPGGFTYLNVLALTGFDAGPSTALALGLLASGALLILGRTLLVRRRRGSLS